MIANRQPSKFALLAGGVAAALAVAWLQREPGDSPTTIAWSKAPLSTGVYIWQRSWTPAVGRSIAALSPESPDYCALGLEFGFDLNGNLDTAQFTDLDGTIAAQLAEEQRLSVAVRIHQNPTGWTPNATAAACDEIAKLSARLAHQGISPTELQIDYDCPQSKLADYAAFVTALRDRLASQPLTITALPSWLGEADFPALIDATDGYVLQVHALSLPSSNTPDGVVLCDPGEAMFDIERAAELGRPFRVALPTYSSIVLFDADGDVVDVVSEDLQAPTPEYHRAEFAHADEAGLAELVASLNARHPAALRGIVWYRLPIESDRMNWPMAAFRRAITGQIPTSASEIELETEASSGVVNVSFVNRGETAVVPPAQVRIDGPGLIAFDGLAGYDCELAEDGSGALLITAPTRTTGRLRPGDAIPLAWLRHEPGTLTARIQ